MAPGTGTGTYGNGTGAYGGSGTTGTTGYDNVGTGGGYTEEKVVGVAEVPIVAQEQHHQHHHASEEVCGQKTFTEVEDRPVVKERVERYVEHHPVEKQFVVETKYVGEKPVAAGAGVTVVGQDEYVVEAAEPGPKCPTGAGRMMDEVIGGTTGAGATGTGAGLDRDRRL